MRHELTDVFPTGTSLRGHITATFDDLVKTFGYPNMQNETMCPADKVWWEWCVEFYDDVEDEYILSTIYDWKEIGPSSARTGEYRWHIGGKTMNSVFAVAEALTE
jgi:hypothetical protein